MKHLGDRKGWLVTGTASMSQGLGCLCRGDVGPSGKDRRWFADDLAEHKRGQWKGATSKTAKIVTKCQD